MKKFLFTLAALLMAGSLFARDYLYIDNFEVKKDELGTTKVIPVKAHFDRYVSAWEIWLTMPEGVTVTAWEEGDDVFGLPYVNQNGKSRTLDASITTKDNAHFIAITSALQGDYIQNEEGAWISAGPVHWEPGDYEMILLTVSIDENFKGGVISVKSAPACGNDLRPEVQENKADGTVETEECTVTVEKSAAPQPTLTWNDVTYTMTASCDGHQVVLMINNEAVENPYTVAQTDKDQTIEFSAYTVANSDESGNSETIKQTVTVPAKVVETIEKPTITFAGEETTTMTVTVECEDAEATLIVNGVEIESNVYTYTVERADLYTAGTVEVTAQAKKGDVLSEEVKESKDWVVKEKPQFEASVKVNHTGDENNFYLLYRTEGADPDQNPVVTVTVTVDGTPLTNVEFLQNWARVEDYTDPDDGYMKAIYNHVKLTEPGEHTVVVELTVAPGPGYAGEPKTASAEWKYTINNKFQGEIVFGDVDPTTGKMSVTYNGPEEGYTMSISLNGQDADVDENGMIQLQEGENKIIVTLTKAGYDMKTAEANPTWTKPAQTAKPNIAQEDVEGGVKVSATGEGTVKLYVDGVEVENPYIIYQTNEDKTYKVTATAQKEGELISETATLEVTVPAKPVVPVETKTFVKVTSAAQLVAGKNYIFVCGDYAMGAEATGNFLLPIAITGGDEVEVGTDVAIMTLGGSAGAWTLALGDQYLTAGNSTDLGFGSKATEWVITNNEGALAGFRAKHHDYSRAIRKHNSMERFGNYSTSDVNSEFAWIYVEKPAEPVLQDLTGKIVVSEPDANGVVTVTYTGDEDVTITVNGEPVAESYQLEDGVPMTFKVTVSAEGYKDLTAEETRTWTKPTPKELTGEITFNVTQGNKNNEAAGIVTATYDGPETGVTVKIVGDPTKVAAATSAGVRLNDYGTYQVKAVATATGYADLEEEGEVTWEEPQTAAPEITVTEDGLTVEATGEGTVTLYVVDANGNETAIVNPTTFAQKDEAYTVNLKAVAHVDGAKDGVATKTIIIPAKGGYPTGVNELVDGKAVKSVRYFNMAGQEMQEVNGVTIVVTTYTDGTTSAVKVMK